jgi:hypothetical protein
MPVEFDLTGLHDEHTIRANVPPPLSELCVRVLAANFASRPTLRGIAPRYINRMTELLPTDLPLEVTGPLIDDEGYWKRCATARWDNCEISAHGSSWKRCYFERNLAEFLENFNPIKQDTEDLTRVLAVSKDYIFSLKIKQVPAFYYYPSSFSFLSPRRRLSPFSPHALTTPLSISRTCSSSRTSTWRCSSRTSPPSATST